MFESLRKLVTEIGDGGKHASRFDATDYRLAAAALLVHAACIDGNFAEVEHKKLHAVIIQRFELTAAAADELIAKASAVEQEAIDLYSFTAKLNRSLDEHGRARIIEMMWQIVYADGIITEFEDNLIWRAADLLGISRRERIALRQRVTGASGGGD
jgi:uncharacterized tellurite resistance protein B-like protein